MAGRQVTCAEWIAYAYPYAYYYYYYCALCVVRNICALVSLFSTRIDGGKKTKGRLLKNIDGDSFFFLVISYTICKCGVWANDDAKTVFSVPERDHTHTYATLEID